MDAHSSTNPVAKTPIQTITKKKIYKNLSASEQNQMQILYHFYVLMLKYK